MKHSIIICTLFMFCLNTKLKAQTNFTKCQDIAISLLISSDYFKKVTKNREELIKKNGGSNFGIQALSEDSKKVTLNIVEHYPDRDMTTNWFIVDKKSATLYEQFMDDEMHRNIIPLTASQKKSLKAVCH